MSYAVTRDFHWDMAHRVPLHDSKCKNLHGHRYKAEVTCVAGHLTREGFVIDFGIVKRIVGEWLDEYWDHNVLYQEGDALMEEMAKLHGDCEYLKNWYSIPDAPTAENIARHLFETATDLLGRSVRVTKVVVHETPNCRAEWSG